MNNFEELIKKKTNEELIGILNQRQDYQPEFIELVEKETEIRNISSESYEKYIQDKETEEKCKEEEKIKKKGKYGIWLIISGITLFWINISNLDIIQSIKQIQVIKLLSSFWWGVFLFLGIYNIVENKMLKKSGQSFAIKGWLIFFLSLIVSFVCGTIYIGVMQCVIFPESVFIRGIAMNLLTNVIFPIYVFYLFFTVKPNAVFIGKAYSILKVLQYPLMYFISLPINPSSLAIDGSFAITWFLYLTYSKQIQVLFPEEQRKVFKIDKFIIAILALTIIIPYIIAIAKDTSILRSLGF